VRLISFDVLIARFFCRGGSAMCGNMHSSRVGLYIKSLHKLVKNALSARCPGTGRIPGLFVMSIVPRHCIFN